MKPSIKRIFHPYWKWEEVDFNMWGRVKDREAALSKAIEFTGSHCLYGIYMRRVVHEWPFSCEHNLSAIDQNRKAWLGHAACALALQYPEDIIRQAWGRLSEEQQTSANNQAQRAIEHWEAAQCQK